MFVRQPFTMAYSCGFCNIILVFLLCLDVCVIPLDASSGSGGGGVTSLRFPLLGASMHIIKTCFY
jgi:hypothetical protein